MHGETITQYARRLRDAYQAKAELHSDFISPQFARLRCSDQAIYQAGVALSSLSFAGVNFDVKGVAYEEVIRGTFDKGDNQQFFTPHQVVSFMAACMKPYLTGVIADPACGTAGFLAEVTRTHARYKNLIGLEIDERLRWVAGINLLLHGASKFSVKCLQSGGTLGEHGRSYFGAFDAILTNPPIFLSNDAGRCLGREGI
ncbi:MAG: N-6 DNA methylase [Betaproteobacteria bacterium]|nr:N-6 DNA methylase [Betaproteobacteria bacterium]